ncbi:ATP-binding protein [Cognatishimia sp. SS12]|uniref:ATP-binding protein n=1 Tax=Cognatishimia sp. SS12 TaxID=2979465 RepID=UPI00232F0215|nr:ATP-binding protein [Cognatishimia sp. SS12]MDC0737287.1 ATP-binding protein [Cognatishimia sp. SS12]
MIQSMLDAVPLPAVFIGMDARIQGANARALAIKPNAGENRTFILVFRQPGFSAAIEKCLRSRETQHAIYVHTDGSQETRYEVTCSFVKIADGGGVMACFQDVTQLQQAGEIRREFVANVSHELKTPLTALLGFIETLRGPAKDDANARERFLSIMATEASRMNRLVGDLLSLSRVEEDARMRPTEPVDLVELIATVIRNLGEVAQDRGQSILFDAPQVPIVVPGDRDQLMQVFINLIENALKYGGADGGEGTVTISMHPLARDPSLRKDAVRIAIQDTGPGIDEVHLPRLTERFYRIDSHRSREMGGTGLGLAIVKHIVARHRGRMKIESVVGKGSVFSIFLPVE